VVDPLSSTVLVSNYDSAFSALTSFRWLFLVSSGGSNMFALISPSFTSVTTINNHLKGLGHLFDQFLTVYNYFCTVLVCFGFVVGESILFWF
jgi:hypothetical protein